MSKSATSTNGTERWYKPWRRGWPKVLVNKPYTDIDLNRGLSFMPRIVKPGGAMRISLRLMGFR